jgi:hypothetical protein
LEAAADEAGLSDNRQHAGDRHGKLVLNATNGSDVSQANNDTRSKSILSVVTGTHLGNLPG